MKKILLVLLMIFFCVPADAKSTVTLAELTGTVGVQMEEFVRDTVRQSELNGDSLLIFQLDTPGGLVEAMRGIVQSILASRVPVAVWIPSGGRAASAGAFIVQSAHIAAMSPGTNIGAAHPVTGGGENIPDGDMNTKVMNDLKAQMRSVVQLRGRNVDTAEAMITESISLTATEALREKVIDIIAPDVNALIKAASGRRVKLGQQSAKISFDDEVAVNRVNMSFSEQLIQFVSSPEIAYLLLSGGMMAIFFEVITPGGFILGTTGGVMLLLGAIGLKMLPFNWAGIVLIVAGVVLMAVDLIAGTSGLLTLLGLPVMCLGGVFLFRAPGGELLQISLSFIAGTAIALGICFGVVAYFVIKGLRRRISTGKQGMIGLTVEVIADGQVKCHGEIWRAKSDEVMTVGETGIVTAVDGMTLTVRRSAG
ncbi:MAG: nodulation protein NfeD [Synergistaceae bacterium]|nr:nodulation protein NfeD [Synergistaceae bacterium]